MDDEIYEEALKQKLTEIKEEIAEKQRLVQTIFSEIEMKQRMAENIIELLHADGIQLENSELESLGQKSVSDLVFDYLKSSGSQTPSHYRDIANAIMSQGIPLPGKEPAANLLSHISRDDRFVRVSPGTYGLKEWGLEPASQKTRRKKRRRPTK